jgi:hypothetical protein
MSDSYVSTKNGQITTYYRPDARNLFRAKLLRNSIKMYLAVGITPTRGMTITKMLKLATEYTGQTYKRGAGPQALRDLETWLLARQSAMPVIHE